MGDPRRFDLFARLIARMFPDRALRIADVGAGKGALSFALRTAGYSVVPFEPAPRRGGQVRRLSMRVADFVPDDARGFDLLVGMHPDAATDAMLEGAIRHKVPAVVAPCCVRPSAWPYVGPREHLAWRAHLVRESERRGLHVTQTSLPMGGANFVMVTRCPSAAPAVSSGGAP